jgi:WD40 repeat protein/serine/threonine protein kinase
MKSCPDDSLLQQLLAEQLGERERGAVEEHLAGCAACQERLDKLTTDGGSVRWRKAQAPPPAAGPGSDPLLWRRVAALGAALLDHSLPIPAAETPAPEPRTSTPSDTEAGPRPETRFPSVPGYEILSELGRGGMAVVYRARQLSLGRIVALKMILAGSQAGEKERSILRAEAQAIAGLQHPHIVQIYEVGEHDGHLYLSLEYLGGGSLARRLAGAPQPPRDAAALTATLGRTVQFAHERGIVHRDLKPANVLLAVSDQPSAVTWRETNNRELMADGCPLTACTAKIADFGLAKRLDAGVSLFATADIVGTPSYVAPEQVRDKPTTVGPAADIYALGAILYECLTGRAPFRGATAYDTLLQVAHQEPVAPRQLQPTIPRDLETVCLKCLHKNPQRRYPSARELADDLERFLAGTPVLARPVGRLERTGKWMRRRPAVAGLLALVILLTGIAFLFLLWERDSAEARAEAQSNAKEEAGKREEQERQARREMEHLTAFAVFDQANALCEHAEVAAGLLTFADGLELAERVGDAGLARAYRANLAAWQSRLIRRRARLQHKSLVWDVTFNPDGDLIATAGNDRQVQVWDTASGRPHRQPLHHDAPVLCVVFTPDGKRLMSGADDGTISLWDISTGKRLRSWRGKEAVRRILVTPAGDRFVSLAPAGGHACQLWDMAAVEPLADLHADEPVLSAALSPDGQTTVTGGYNGVLRRWQTYTRPSEGEVVRGHDPVRGPIEALAFSPDGKALAAGGRVVFTDANKRRLSLPLAKVWFWDAKSWRARGPVLTQHGRIIALTFSADSRLLATGSVGQDWLLQHKRFDPIAAGDARLYEVATGRRLGRPLPHNQAVMVLAFSPDGRLLLTGCQDGKARLFSVVCGEQVGQALGHEGAVMSLAFSADGRTAVTGAAGGDNIRGAAGGLWVLPTNAAPAWTAPITDGTEHRTALAFTPAGDTLFIGRYGDRLLKSWRVRSGQPNGPELPQPDSIRHLAFSRDGRILAGTYDDQSIHVWDRENGRERQVLAVEDRASMPALSPDGRLLAAELRNGTVLLWDTGSSKPRARYTHKGIIGSLAVPSAERVLWVEHQVRSPYRIWEWTPAEGRRLLREQPPGGWAVLSRDGKAVVLFDADHSPRLYETATGRPLGPPLPFQPNMNKTAFADDGRTVFMGMIDRTARLWDMAIGRPLGPPLDHFDRLLAIALTPDARLMATTDAGGTYLRHIPPPLAGTPKAIRRQIELLTGMTRDSQGAVRELSPAELDPAARAPTPSTRMSPTATLSTGH